MPHDRDVVEEQDSEIAFGKTVLVVDDDPDIRTMVKAIILNGFKGVTVRTASDGSSGLTALKNHDIDVVLCDQQMPNMDGLTFLTQASEIKPDVPRVMITGVPDRALQTKATEQAAVSTFFSKPINAETVEFVVRDMLRERWLTLANS